MPTERDDDSVTQIISGIDDPPELRRLVARIPESKIGIAALRMAWKQRNELLTVREIARKWDMAKDDDAKERGLILRNLGLISTRLGILEVDELGTTVVSAEPLTKYRMAVQFSDGASGIVDLKEMLKQPGWGELRDEKKFRLLVVEDMGGIVWPDPGLKLSVKALYAMAHGMPIPIRKDESTTKSQRPVSHHDFPTLLAQNLPKVEQAEADRRWLGLRELLRNVFKDGFVRGAKITVGTLVTVTGLLVAGYFIRDCRQVLTGHTGPVPHIHPIGE
jgi:hypothetical protein